MADAVLPTGSGTIKQLMRVLKRLYAVDGDRRIAGAATLLDDPAYLSSRYR